MTYHNASFLDVIAADQTEHIKLARKAAVLSQLRVDNMFGAFIAANGESALDYLEEEIKTVVATACEEVGFDDVDGTLATVLADKKNTVPNGKDSDEPDDDDEVQGDDVDGDKKTASVHESRKPKMCNYHTDVVDISLAQGEPRAGFDSMTQHWGGPNHCKGEGYEGGKCNFKPQMTTQAFWDEKAEKAEQRRLERQELAEQQVEQEAILESPTEDTEPTSPVEDISTESEGAEVIDFPSAEPSAIGEGIDTAPEALAVAAKTAGDPGCGRCGASGAKPGKPCPECGYTGGNEEDPVWGGDKSSKTAADDNLGGKGVPAPTINKKKWTPQSVPAPELEGDESRHPTKRIDVAGGEALKNKSELSEIGENKTERVDLPSSDNAGFSHGGETGEGQGGTWSEKAPSAVTGSHDPDKNGLVAIMESNYDGLLPQLEVQQAVIAHRRS